MHHELGLTEAAAMASCHHKQEHLPHYDVLRQVCAFIEDPSDKQVLRMTNNAWHEAVADTVQRLMPSEPNLDQIQKSFPHVRSLDMHRCSYLTDGHLARLAQMQAQLRSVRLHGHRRISDRGLQALSQMTGLTSLELSRCGQVSWHVLQHLEALRCLRSLTLLDLLDTRQHRAPHQQAQEALVPLLEAGLQRLVLGSGACVTFLGQELIHLLGAFGTQLLELHLGGNLELTDAGLASLAELPALLSLDLRNCHKVSGAGLASLACGLQHLSHLCLKGCKQLGDADAAQLAGLTSLRALDLQGCAAISGSCFALLAPALGGLADLRLAGCGALGDETVAHLAQLRGLRCLDASGCTHLSLAGLQQLSLLTGLTRLVVRGFQNTRQAVAGAGAAADAADAAGDCAWRGWAQLKGLQDLDLSSFKHPAGLPAGLVTAIGRLPALKQLDLSSSKLARGVHLGLLQGLQHLQDLDLALALDSWHLRDESQGLAPLASLTALTRLHLQPGADVPQQPQLHDLDGQQGSASASAAAHITIAPGDGSGAGGSSSSSSSSGSSSSDTAATSNNGNSSVNACRSASSKAEDAAEPRQWDQCLAELCAMHLSGDVAGAVGNDGRGSGTGTSSSTSSSARAFQHMPPQHALNASLVLLGRRLQQLQQLSLQSQPQLSDAGLWALAAGLSRLQCVRLSGCRGITGTGLEGLAGAAALRHLDLSGCAALTDAGAAAIGRLSSLTRLELAHCGLVSDQGLAAAVSGLWRLRRLGLRGLRRLSAGGLRALLGCQMLTDLDLSYCQGLRDEGLHVLAQLSGLRDLQLVCCWRITDAGLEVLQRGAAGRRLVVNANGCPWLSACWFKPAGRAHAAGQLQLLR